MSFTVHKEADGPVVTMVGKFLGSVECERFQGTIHRLKEEGQTQIVVDLSQTDFMDSSGIGLLVSALTTLRQAGGDLRLAHVEDRIRFVFMTTKLLEVFEAYPTVEGARQSFEVHPPQPAKAPA